LALPLLKKLNANQAKTEMTFIDHLEVLRWHIVRAVLVVLVFAIAVGINIDWFFDNIIYGPLREDFVSYRALCDFGRWLHLGDVFCMQSPNVQMISTKFSSQFIGAFAIALMGGFICAFPYILWEVWRFIKPALNPKEIKIARNSIFWITLFFLTGISFGYFILAPFTFSFLSNFQLGTLNAIRPSPTFDDYIDNMMNILLGTSISFELPVFSYVLTKIGLISPTLLRNYRKYALVIILIVAAIITPSPDITSQMLVTLPLWMLYELSIFISYRVQRDEDKRREAFFKS
jgi:sec-independent protein translocase protein TatC